MVLGSIFVIWGRLLGDDDFGDDFYVFAKDSCDFGFRM